MYVNHVILVSAFMPKIKEGRSVKIEALCDFDDVEMKAEKVIVVIINFKFLSCNI